MDPGAMCPESIDIRAQMILIQKIRAAELQTTVSRHEMDAFQKFILRAIL